MTVEAYPLQWPEGWPSARIRKDSQFKTSFAIARDCTFEEVKRLGGKLPILSTNVELRRDGLPYANRKPWGSPGAALYFTLKDRPMCFACDKYHKVEDNIQAIRKTIEALRGIERWGASDMMERAFQGFVSLTDQSDGAWWAILGVSEISSRNEVEAAYKAARKKAHPDHGGSDEEFHRVQSAWNEYQEKMGVRA